jgi:formylglycine-generating enzyme required for sulfatase activity
LKKLITIYQLDNEELQFSSDDQPIVIGSGPEAHIILPGLASVIGFIADEQGHLYIQPAPGTASPLLHNDRIITESTWLKSKDTLQIDKYRIFYEHRGDRLFFTVSDHPAPRPSYIPQPPSQPPDASAENTGEPIPVESPPAASFTGIPKFFFPLLAVASVLLGLGVLFVLFARPLELSIEPAPDSVSLSGFPPAISFGSRYLCLPGDYTITVEKEGYKTLSADVRIYKGRENRFSADLAKLPGILRLAVIPEGPLSIFSGDRKIGSTPPDFIELPAGPNRLVLKRQRYQPHEVEMEIVGRGKIQTLEVSLKPDWADIDLRSIPSGADVSIDGVPAGKTPLAIQLLSGEHDILITQDLFVPAGSTLTVTAGQPQQHSVQLQPLPGTLTITSNPAGAAIRVNKEFKGGVPLSLQLAPDIAHTIEATLPGYVVLPRKVQLGPGEQKEIEFELEPQQGTVFLALSPPDANLSLDGTAISNRQLQLTLPTRPHVLEITADGYLPVQREILPKAGYTQRITISLERKSPVPEPGPAIPARTIQTAQGHTMLPVIPAPFTMGSPRREPGRRSNEHERRVQLNTPYYLSERLVTNKDYRGFKKDHDSGSFSGISLNGESQPVVNITWEEAVAFLNWLSEKDGLQPFYRKDDTSFTPVTPPTKGYRLPTEAEWAFAARILGSPVLQRFPWSGGFPPRMATGNFADESARRLLPNIISGYTDTFPVTSPVGSFPPNKGGFYDMGGNVAEWCNDYYAAYISSKQNQSDPLGPETGAHRVVRGSSWRDSSITELRLSFRGYQRQARNNIGFRIARYP